MSPLDEASVTWGVEPSRAKPIKTLRIDVTPWPCLDAAELAEEYFNDHPEYQWDLYIDGEHWGGGTGPGDAEALAGQALDCYGERDDDL